MPFADAWFIAPQLATLKPKPPAGDRWIHEIKFDGYRSQLRVSDAGTEIFTRKSLNWTKRFTGIAAAYASAGLGSAIVDDEIVVVVNERTDFSAPQADLAVGRQDRQRFEPKGGIRLVRVGGRRGAIFPMHFRDRSFD
ncbi:hypothetical protein [Bradyrhizobium japonicum]|uniref:ATP-dependent DNA ligase n=1 Tax=Bradyrhizobium japonicum TaxID=375 RepID=UPI00200F67E9|nr:hypothetical protein [Bradyrhizobium japonicum]